MRFKFPISSEELKDEFRSIYMDMVNLIGYTDASGTVEVSGVYDIIDDDIDSIKNTSINNYAESFSYRNLLRSKSNVRILKG